MFAVILLCILSFTASMEIQSTRVPEDPLTTQQTAVEIQSTLEKLKVKEQKQERLLHQIIAEQDENQDILKRLETRVYKLCPVSYTAVGKFCYKIYFEPKDWLSAKAKCESDGAHLVAVGSEEEQKAIKQFLAKYPDERFWAGGNDRETEGRWVWDATGQEIQNTSYTYWATDGK